LYHLAMKQLTICLVQEGVYGFAEVSPKWGWPTSRKDPPLTDAGIKQIRKAASELHDYVKRNSGGFPNVLCCASKLQRSQMACDIINTKLNGTTARPMYILPCIHEAEGAHGTIRSSKALSYVIAPQNLSLMDTNGNKPMSQKFDTKYYLSFLGSRCRSNSFFEIILGFIIYPRKAGGKTRGYGNTKLRVQKRRLTNTKTNTKTKMGRSTRRLSP